MAGELWRYSPEKCEGDYCPKDCDRCDRGDWGEDDEDETD